MPAPSPNPFVIIPQRSTGPARVSIGHPSFMCWTGDTAGGYNYINLSVDPAGGIDFSRSITQSTYKSNFAPGFAAMPDGKSGYVAWLDAASGKLLYTTVQANSSGTWSFSTAAPLTVPAVKPTEGPTIEIGASPGGDFHVWITYQDAAPSGAVANSIMVYTLSPFSGVAPQLSAVGQRSSGPPIAAQFKGTSFLAWTGDSNGSYNFMNFATDPKGGTNFGQAIYNTSYKSSFGPGFGLFPQGDMAFMAWLDSGTSKLSYCKLAKTNGTWAFVANSLGTVPATKPTQGPSIAIGPSDHGDYWVYIFYEDASGKPADSVMCYVIDPFD